jgi:hypothetical protein
MLSVDDEYSSLVHCNELVATFACVSLSCLYTIM